MGRGRGSGQPQFYLPVGIITLSITMDGDERKDIWKSLPDAFASIANYLAQHGWKANQPWAIQVQLPSPVDTSLVNSRVNKTVRE